MYCDRYGCVNYLVQVYDVAEGETLVCPFHKCFFLYRVKHLYFWPPFPMNLYSQIGD